MIYTQSIRALCALSFLATVAVIGCLFSLGQTRKITKNVLNTTYPKKQVNQVQKCLQSGSSVVQDLQAKLSKIHKKALSDLKNEFKISTKDWNRTMADFNYAKSTNPIVSGKPVSLKANAQDNEVIRLAKECLVCAGISPEDVSVVDTNYSGPACAFQNFNGTCVEHTLHVDANKLRKKSIDTQKAIFNHEIQHLVHYDPLEAGYITRVLSENGYSKDDTQHAESMIQYCQQREHRADLLASCKDIAIAKAFQQDFAHEMRCEGQDNPELWITHPSDKKRHQEITNLIARMEIESNLQSTNAITLA